MEPIVSEIIVENVFGIDEVKCNNRVVRDPA
jgi:hypothetical protein